MNTFEQVRKVLAWELGIPEQDISAQTLLSDLIFLAEPAPVIIDGVDLGVGMDLASHFHAMVEVEDIAEELKEKYDLVITQDAIAEHLFEAVRSKEATVQQFCDYVESNLSSNSLRNLLQAGMNAKSAFAGSNSLKF